MTSGSAPPAPSTDADVPGFLAALGIPGIVDVHVHFLPERVLRKVWAYFDGAAEHCGMAWPVHYRLPEPERFAVLKDLGVTAFAPLVYPHRPGMARWLTEWVTEFAAAVSSSTGTMHERRCSPSACRGMIRRPARVTLVRPPYGRRKGVNGFDSGCRSRGSVPRKATMISKTTRRKKTSADTSRTDQNAFALAG